MANWTCRCSAKNAERDRYCEGCGEENPKALRHPAPSAHVPETHVPAKFPEFREPTPEEDAEIRATLARVKAAPWWRNTQGTARLPDVDPTIRAKVEGQPMPIGALVTAKLGELKGER